MEHKIILTCQKWAAEYVVGLNLCPFAKKALDNGEIKWVVASDPNDVVAHIDRFLDAQQGSLFVILPQAKDFFSYLESIAIYEDYIAKIGYESDIKLVSFHPDHRYEGIPLDDEVNFANRSPYPMFQLLWQSELKSLGMTDKWKEEILTRNTLTLKEMGREQLKDRLHGYEE